MANRVVQQCHW